MQTRPYQKQLQQDILQAWESGHRNVLAVLPTGAGKTWVFTEIVKMLNVPTAAIAHRQELVAQISLSFAKHGIYHRIIGPDNVIRMINRLQIEELGTSFYHPSASTAVVGVDTLVRRQEKLQRWASGIKLWVQDECQHLLKPHNKWGKVISMFPNAKGLGVTATPTRADGKGLGRDADGLMDIIIKGPEMRELITAGYLTDYRVFAPPSNLDLSTVKTGSDGDYSRPSLKKAVQKSQIVGDVVSHYLRIAPGKLGITFATDVETATNIAAQFNAAGVPAEVVSAKTPDLERIKILRRFKNRQIIQLVNVDIFGEGFDLPAIEVVSMARPTQSYGLYTQQFGRGLRILEGKSRAIIIDHVGNVVRHNLPDKPREWTLDRRDRKHRKTEGEIPVRACPQCTGVYERVALTCPYCGYVPVPMSRSGPEFVDGDLTELSPEALAQMRGESVDVDLTPAQYLAESGAGRLNHVAALSAAKRFRAKQAAQVQLREQIALWAGYQRALGRSDAESYRYFYYTFNGIDVLSAQALNAQEANALTEKINSVLTKLKT